MSKHRVNAFTFALISSFFLLTTAFRIPKPTEFTLPHKPYEFNYRDYHPSREGSGFFDSLNQSITPWEVSDTSNYDTSRNDTTSLKSETGACTTAQGSGGNSFWLPNIEHQGTSPFLNDSLDYVVYRNVKDFGAKGDGETDDSAAFNAAITGTFVASSHIGNIADISAQMAVDAKAAIVAGRRASRLSSIFLPGRIRSLRPCRCSSTLR